MDDELITIEELALLTGCSVQTLNMYYRFKRENPDSEYSLMLPDYIQDGIRQTRYWKREDANAIIWFRKLIPQGRGGVLGSVTQRHNKKVNMVNDASYIDKIDSILKQNNVDKSAIQQIREILLLEQRQRNNCGIQKDLY